MIVLYGILALHCTANLVFLSALGVQSVMQMLSPARKERLEAEIVWLEQFRKDRVSK